MVHVCANFRHEKRAIHICAYAEGSHTQKRMVVPINLAVLISESRGTKRALNNEANALLFSTVIHMLSKQAVDM